MWKGQDFPVTALFGVAISLTLLGWDCGHGRQIVAGSTGVATRLCGYGKIYYPQKQKCYTPGTRGPCTHGKWFWRSTENRHFGECTCVTAPCRKFYLMAGDESIRACRSTRCSDKYTNQPSATQPPAFNWKLRYEEEAAILNGLIKLEMAERKEKKLQLEIELEKQRSLEQELLLLRQQQDKQEGLTWDERFRIMLNRSAIF